MGLGGGWADLAHVSPGVDLKFLYATLENVLMGNYDLITEGRKLHLR